MKESRQTFLNLFCILWLLLLLKSASSSPPPHRKDPRPPSLPFGLYKGHTCVGMYPGFVGLPDYLIPYFTGELRVAIHIVNCSFISTAVLQNTCSLKQSLKIFQGHNGIWNYFMILFLTGCLSKIMFLLYGEWHLKS